jgi:hypothetical protein
MESTASSPPSVIIVEPSSSQDVEDARIGFSPFDHAEADTGQEGKLRPALPLLSRRKFHLKYNLDDTNLQHQIILSCNPTSLPTSLPTWSMSAVLFVSAILSNPISFMFIWN